MFILCLNYCYNSDKEFITRHLKDKNTIICEKQVFGVLCTEKIDVLSGALYKSHKRDRISKSGQSWYDRNKRNKPNNYSVEMVKKWTEPNRMRFIIFQLTKECEVSLNFEKLRDYRQHTKFAKTEFIVSAMPPHFVIYETTSSIPISHLTKSSVCWSVFFCPNFANLNEQFTFHVLVIKSSKIHTQ